LDGTSKTRSNCRFEEDIQEFIKKKKKGRTMALEQEQIQSICVDTLTSIQENEMSAAEKKPEFNEWFDWGIGVHRFLTQLLAEGFELVLILGPPGSGKSTGVKTLESGTNVLYNTDNKNPTWIGGRQEYGKKAAPIAPFHIIPASYDHIIEHVRALKSKGYLSKNPIAFISGHVENFKQGKEQRVRLKTLGKLANKMEVEGKLEVVLYSKVISDGAGVKYILETQNDGTNTGRSNEGMLPSIIPNDYKLVRDAIIAY
jgi:hypothetical protein